MQEDIHVHVKLPELDGRAAGNGGLPRKEAAPGGENHSLGVFPAGTSLLTLKDRCKAHLATQAQPQAWETMNDLFRHFWIDGEFQPYYRAAKAENRLENIAKSSFATLTFARDVYIIRTPRGTCEWVLNPEIPVREVLENLHTADKIDDICCYDVFDHKGIALKLTDSLYSQNALPYNGLAPQNNSRLEVRLKADPRRRAALLLLVLALVGFGVGFLIRRFAS